MANFFRECKSYIPDDTMPLFKLLHYFFEELHHTYGFDFYLKKTFANDESSDFEGVDIGIYDKHIYFTIRKSSAYSIKVEAYAAGYRTTDFR